MTTNRYVIRYSPRPKQRVRRYFRTREQARTFAKLRGLPQSQIKANVS